MADRYMNKFLDMSSDMWESLRETNGILRREYDLKIDTITNKLRETQDNLENAKTELGVQKAEIDRLKTENNNIMWQKDRLSVEKDALNAEIFTNRGLVKELEFQKGMYERENKVLREERESLNRELKKLKVESEAFCKDITKARNELEKEKKAANAIKEKAEVYETRYGSLKNSMEKIWGEVQAPLAIEKAGPSHKVHTPMKRKYEVMTEYISESECDDEIEQSYNDNGDENNDVIHIDDGEGDVINNDNGEDDNDDDVIYVATKLPTEDE